MLITLWGKSFICRFWRHTLFASHRASRRHRSTTGVTRADSTHISPLLNIFKRDFAGVVFLACFIWFCLRIVKGLKKKKKNSGELGYMKIATQLLVFPRRNASACCDYQVHVQGTLHYSRCPLLTEPGYPSWGWGGRWVSGLCCQVVIVLLRVVNIQRHPPPGKTSSGLRRAPAGVRPFSVIHPPECRLLHYVSEIHACFIVHLVASELWQTDCWILIQMFTPPSCNHCSKCVNSPQWIFSGLRNSSQSHHACHWE